MTTDDLRTRAREAAEEAYRKPRWHVGTVTDRLIEAFYDGYLAHAAQQPSHDREAEAEAIREAADYLFWDWDDDVATSTAYYLLLDRADSIESQETP